MQLILRTINYILKELLHIENLTVKFSHDDGEVTATDGISFSVAPSEIVAVVGESGSGKSVTALSVMQLLGASGRISDGQISFTDKASETTVLSNLPENKIRTYRGNRIAMIFQEPMTSLNPVLTCGFQVAEALMLHKKLSKAEARSQTIELFKEVELPRPEAIFDSYPHQISGGQKQRVMIAMAISCQPDLLIADEPTTALDVTVQKTILELLKRLQVQHQMSIIFITHDLGVVAELAHKVVVMYKSKIVEQGETQQLFSSPQHPYTKGLLACRPPVDVRPVRLPTINDFTENETPPKITLQSKAERARQHKNLYEQSPLLEVKNLTVRFTVKKNWLGKPLEKINAVDNVSFDVYPKETLGLVGESGCGKTTLSRALLRLIEPDAGEILFNGQPILPLSFGEMRKLRKEMQLIFQDPYSSLNPRIAIGKAIMEPMKIHGVGHSAKERRERVEYLLKRVGLSESHFDRYPHEFSGGQRQRVCIARAIGLNPSFVICDESVSALDVSVQAQVLNLLNELKEEFGFTYIFISHDLSVVKYMADRVMVMNKGKIEEIQEADALYENPGTPYTRKLIDSLLKVVSKG